MRRYRERMSQEQREDILERRCQSRHEEAEAMSVRDREDYLQNERNLFQSITQEHFSNWNNTIKKIYIATKIIQQKK